MQRNLRAFLTAAASLSAALIAGCGRSDADSRAYVPARTNDAFVAITPADTPPYSYRDEKTGEIVGLEIDIIREAAKALGRRVEFHVRAFDSLLRLVKMGEADMAASSLTITEVRQEDVDFSEPYTLEGGMFLYRAGERMPTMIVAETLRVGTVESMTHDFYLSTHGIDPVRLPTYTDAVRALEAGRVDTVYFDSSAVRLSVANSGGRFAASRLETREYLGIAVRKGMPALKAALDAAIARRKGDVR